MTNDTTFEGWLDQFVKEKELDTETTFEVRSENGTLNMIDLGSVLVFCKNTLPINKNLIVKTLVKLDFKNQDVMGFFKYIAEFMAIDLPEVKRE
jgi:hypothetical protein